jgi:hypothetical protein
VERLRVRLAVLSSRHRLDQDIADGHPPAASAAHQLRSRQLADLATRRQLARSLRQAVSDAEATRVRLYAVVPPLRREVRTCREALLGVADRLDSPEPLNSCGVARAMMLLTDGTGPLYCRLAGHSLEDAIWWIADGLHEPAIATDRTMKPA